MLDNTGYAAHHVQAVANARIRYAACFAELAVDDTATDVKLRYFVVYGTRWMCQWEIQDLRSLLLHSGSLVVHFFELNHARGSVWVQVRHSPDVWHLPKLVEGGG
jgi:hypothetical protein